MNILIYTLLFQWLIHLLKIVLNYYLVYNESKKIKEKTISSESLEDSLEAFDQSTNIPIL